MSSRFISTLSWPALLVATLFANGIFYSQQASSPQRVGPARTHVASPDHRVEATLWEDPFQAARSHFQEEQQQKERRRAKHKSSKLTKVLNAVTDVHLLLVMTSSGRDAKSHEGRLQARYAVMSALRSQSLIPDHKEQINFFMSSEYTCELSREKDLPNTPVHLDSFTVYESFSPAEKTDETEKDKKDESKKVVVVWLPDGAFKTEPLARFKKLVSILRKQASKPGITRQISLIGPNSSDILKKVLDEGKGESHCCSDRALKDVRVYSAFATAPFVKCEVDTFRKKDYFGHFERLIGSDANLCNELVCELKRRDINPASNSTDHILLVANWNDYFTRTLPQTFRGKLSEHDSDSKLDNVHVFTFANGIDGDLSELRDSPTSNYRQTHADEEYGNSPETSIYPLASRVEKLIDYLRRLAGVLRDDVRSKSGHIRAIGIFSGDIYDRLQILHLLKNEFPNALFFTNDLDVRFTDKAYQSFTRNLLVASHFGLRLSDKYHVGSDGQIVPPFRTGYQTARYFACWQALQGRDQLEDAENVAIDFPRLFEIGNGCIVDLSVKPGVIHPQPRAALFRGETASVPAAAVFTTLQYCVISAVTLLLLVSVSKTFADRFRHARRSSVGEYSFHAFLVGAALLALVISYDHYLNPEGEYWSLTTGTSIWGSVVLQYIAVAIAVYCIFRGGKAIHNDKRKAESKFLLPEEESSDAPTSGILELYWRRCTFEGLRTSYDAIVGSRTNGSIPVDELWKVFNGQRSWRRMSLRVGFHSLMLLIFFIALMGVREPISGAFRGTPSRIGSLIGDYASLSALVVLTFVVVDMSLLSSRFIRKLASGRSRWPAATLEHFREIRNCDDAILNEWLDIQLIAKHSKRTQDIVYGPFIVLALLCLGRLQYIDNFAWPPSLIVFLSILFAYMTICTFVLRWAAEKGRRQIVRRLEDYIFRERGSEQEKNATHILNEIRHESRGAFSPVSENPVIRALLIPSGGASLLALVDLFS